MRLGDRSPTRGGLIARVREPEREHVSSGPGPRQVNPYVSEIHVRFSVGREVIMWCRAASLLTLSPPLPGCAGAEATIPGCCA